MMSLASGPSSIRIPPISALARLTTVARHTAPAADQISRLRQGDLRVALSQAAPEAPPIRLQAGPAFQGPYRTVQTLGLMRAYATAN